MDRWLYWYVVLIIAFGGATLAFTPKQKIEKLDDDFAVLQEFLGFER